MDNKIKEAFDTVKAEEALKEQTLVYIKQYQSPKKKILPIRLAAAVAASVLLLAAAGGTSYQVYAKPQGYVDLDVNPSIELTLNRFERVIHVHAYNADGAKLLEDLALKNKKYENALTLLLNRLEDDGYLTDDGMIYVTVQSKEDEAKLLETAKENVASVLSSHHVEMEQEITAVDSETKAYSHHMNVSPAKYQIYQEIREVDDTVTADFCHDHSVSDMKEYLEEHGGHHGETDETESEHGEDAHGSGEHEGDAGNASKETMHDSGGETGEASQDEHHSREMHHD